MNLCQNTLADRRDLTWTVCKYSWKWDICENFIGCKTVGKMITDERVHTLKLSCIKHELPGVVSQPHSNWAKEQQYVCYLLTPSSSPSPCLSVCPLCSCFFPLFIDLHRNSWERTDPLPYSHTRREMWRHSEPSLPKSNETIKKGDRVTGREGWMDGWKCVEGGEQGR